MIQFRSSSPAANRRLRLLSSFVVLALTLTTTSSLARDMRSVKAAGVGMSAERLERINTLSQQYVDDGKLAGVLTMVSRGGKIVHFEAVGNKGLKDKRKLEKDDLFRIYSMSKPITAVAAMQLYEQGKFQLSDPISKWVPELAELEVLVDGQRVPANGPITMQQLLTHTAGFSYGFDPKDPVDQLYREAQILRTKDLDAFVTELGKLPLKYHPGEQWHYSVAVDITGLIVQRISGQRFDEYLQEHIFSRLDMIDTFFEVPESKRDRFLPNHGWNPQENKMAPYPDGPNQYVGTTLFSGGGGLVSTAMDYMRFAEMLRNGGSLDGNRILSPKTIEFMTLDHLPASVAASGSGENPEVNISTFTKGFGFGLGFGLVNDVAASAVMGSAGEYSWGGAAGTIFWVDPKEETVTVAMIQLMGSPWPLRSELKVLTNQALTELN